MAASGVNDICALCISLNFVKKQLEATTTVRGIRVCSDHLTELATPDSRAARKLKEMAENIGS